MSKALVSVQLWDFCQFKKAKVPLERQGLVWVGGVNRDTDSADSNGAGKSNLMKAIGWCLYGETPEPEPADHVIREGAKRARVVIKLEGGWKVCRERYKGAPRLTLSHDDKPVRGKRAEIQEQITNLIGLSWRAFLNTTFYASRDGRRFVNPKTSNADRQEILFNILRGHIYAGALEWVREEAKKLAAEISDLEVQITEAKGQLAALDFDRLKERRKAWEGQRSARIDAVKARCRELAESVKKAKKGVSGRGQLERQIEKAKLRFRRAEVAQMKAIDLARGMAPALENASKLKVALQANEEALRTRKAELARLRKLDRCPTCRRALKGANAAEYLATLDHELDAKALESVGWVANLMELEKDIEKRTAEIEELRALDAGRLNTEIQRLEVDLATIGYVQNTIRQTVAEFKERREDIRRQRVEANPYDEELEVARAKSRKAKDRVSVARGEIERLSKELAHWEFWKKGFSASGLPSFALDAVMPELTERANHYLEMLSDGSISVMFSTQRELTSSKGEYRDEITITWVIEGVKDRNPSGGQWRKIEIATDLALMDLALSQDAGALDFLALDEVLDGGLDAVGRLRLITLLHEARKLKGTIFVVSHDADLAGVFDRSLMVTKRNGVAKVRMR